MLELLHNTVHCLRDSLTYRKLEDLPLYISRKLCSGLDIGWGFSTHFDCNKRGQTSRPTVQTEKQTSCNFEANKSACIQHLGFSFCLYSDERFELQYSRKSHHYSRIVVFNNFNMFLHVDFLRCLSSLFVKAKFK